MTQTLLDCQSAGHLLPVLCLCGQDWTMAAGCVVVGYAVVDCAAAAVAVSVVVDAAVVVDGEVFAVDNSVPVYCFAGIAVVGTAAWHFVVEETGYSPKHHQEASEIEPDSVAVGIDFGSAVAGIVFVVEFGSL